MDAASSKKRITFQKQFPRAILSKLAAVCKRVISEFKKYVESTNSYASLQQDFLNLFSGNIVNMGRKALVFIAHEYSRVNYNLRMPDALII